MCPLDRGRELSSLLAVGRQASEELRTREFTVVRQLIPAAAFRKIEGIVTNDFVRHELSDGTLGECGRLRYISIPAGDSSSGLASDRSWERWRNVTALQEALRGNRDAVVGLKIARQFSTDAQIRCDVETVLSEWDEGGWL
jgi:hypothetical protein